MDRRNFIKGSLALLAAAGLADMARAQDGTLIIRSVIDGVPQRYADLSLDGSFLYPSKPVVFNGDDGQYVLFIPKNVTKTRLIVFSHGALADPFTYRTLLWHWASHGYMIAAPIHDDSNLENGPTLRTVGGVVSEWPVSTLLEDGDAWRNRLERCVKCIDIAAETAHTQGFKIEDRALIVGHGYGAYMAQLLMGTEVVAHNGERLRFRDARFFSGIALSPQGPGIMGLDEKSWQNVTSPMLFVVAENDDDFTGQPWQTKGKGFKLCAPGYKHLALIKNGGANVFSNSGQAAMTSGTTPFLSVRGLTTLFLKAYTDYDKQAFADMSSEFFQRMTLGEVVEYKR
jgi:hypothetical protein